MAARNVARNLVAAVSKTGLMPSGYQVFSRGCIFSLIVRRACVRGLRSTEAKVLTWHVMHRGHFGVG